MTAIIVVGEAWAHIEVDPQCVLVAFARVLWLGRRDTAQPRIGCSKRIIIINHNIVIFIAKTKLVSRQFFSTRHSANTSVILVLYYYYLYYSRQN